MRFLHVMVPDKFIPPFIRFVNENFNPKEHLFLILSEESFPPYFSLFLTEISKLNSSNIVILNPNSMWKHLQILMYMYGAEKIIIHGLWSRYIVEVLFRRSQLLEKSYWIIWGGDFYFPEQQSFTKKMVIKNIRHIITYSDGDVEYIRKSYGANPIHHRCFCYLSNVFDENKYGGCKRVNKHDIWILVGNSATETNRHELVFDKLKRFKDDNIRLIVPLSYGDDEYRKRIIEIGRREFSNKFYPIVKFLPFEQYLNIIFNIDIAIFFHNRSQAMGNIIQILGLGKKVFLDRINNPLYQLFRNLGVKVYDFETEFNLIANEKELISNSEIIKKTFSLEQLKLQLENIFYGRNK